ncbi:MAG: hypothetical protein E2P02_10625 [Acidobacteria bacterium]|nr:MAG: hypothetical protein E2P02_10625 [Acidobacteriota bacterium]
MQTDGGFELSEPRLLFEANYLTSGVVNYHVAPDGQHFVMSETDPNGDGRRLEIVLNWMLTSSNVSFLRKIELSLKRT